MHKRITVSALVGAGLFSFAALAFSATGYEGYGDTIDASPWFDGVRSTIDYQATVVAEDVAAWAGIDNNAEDDVKWIQGGWGRRAGEDAKIYWEYVDKDGNYAIGYDQAPGASETYEQSRNGSNVEWKHGADIYKVVAYSRFDTIEFKKTYYGAEMADSPGDHTPGTAASKNKFAASAARKAGGNFAYAPLAIEFNSATDGNVEKYDPADQGNLRTWDSRN